MHEAFLMRLSMHPVFRADQNLQVFLEFDKDVSGVRMSPCAAARLYFPFSPSLGCFIPSVVPFAILYLMRPRNFPLPPPPPPLLRPCTHINLQFVFPLCCAY